MVEEEEEEDRWEVEVKSLLFRLVLLPTSLLIHWCGSHEILLVSFSFFISETDYGLVRVLKDKTA